MIKRYRYRAYPTPEQENYLTQVFGCVRVVFNDAVALRKQAHVQGQDFPTSAVLSKQLITEAKKTEDRSWLSGVPAVVLQQSIRDADRAYSNFFKSLKGQRKGKKVGAPRFKKRSNKQSARFTRGNFSKLQQTTHEVGFVKLAKIGRVRFELSRGIPYDPSSVTLIKEPDGRYYLSFVVEARPRQPKKEKRQAAGIDMGLTTLASVVCSDGARESVANPRFLKAKEKRLASAQRKLSRKKKGSNNREKARVKVAKLHRKVRETRLDHYHKLAYRLVNENQVIAVETLNVAGLARTKMAKSIHDASWSTFIRLLEEKSIEFGRKLIKIDQWEPTSQVCSVCGIKDGKKPLSVRVWQCQHCNSVLDRDYNAALNVILAAGLAESLNDCGEDVRLKLASANLSETITHRTD